MKKFYIRSSVFARFACLIVVLLGVAILCLGFASTTSSKVHAIEADGQANSDPICSYYTCSLIMSDGSVHIFANADYRTALPVASDSGWSTSAQFLTPSEQNPNPKTNARRIYAPMNNVRAVSGACADYYCTYIMSDGSIVGVLLSGAKNAAENYLTPAPSTSGWSSANAFIFDYATVNSIPRTIYVPVNDVKPVKARCTDYSCSFIMSDGSIHGFSAAVQYSDTGTSKNYGYPAASIASWSTNTSDLSTEANNHGRKIYAPTSDTDKAEDLRCSKTMCVFRFVDGKIGGFSTLVGGSLESFPISASSGWADSAQETTLANSPAHMIYVPDNDVTPVLADAATYCFVFAMSDGSVVGFMNMSPLKDSYSFPHEAISPGWSPTDADYITGSLAAQIPHKIYIPDSGTGIPEAEDVICGRYTCSIIMDDGSIDGFNIDAGGAATTFPATSSSGWSTDNALIGGCAASATAKCSTDYQSGGSHEGEPHNTVNNRGHKIYVPVGGVTPKKNKCYYTACSFIMSDGSIQGFQVMLDASYTYPAATSSPGWSTAPALAGSVDNNKPRTIYIPKDNVEPYYGACNMYSGSFVMSDGSVQGFATSTSISAYYPQYSDSFWSESNSINGTLATNYARQIYILKKVMITQATDILVRNKVYDNTTNASVNQLNQSARLVLYPSGQTIPDGEDDVRVDYSTAHGTFDTIHVGTNKQVVVRGLKLAGIDKDKYELVDDDGNSQYQNNAKWLTKADITPVKLRVTIKDISVIIGQQIILPYYGAFPDGPWTISSNILSISGGGKIIFYGTDNLTTGSVKISDDPSCAEVYNAGDSSGLGKIASTEGEYESCLVANDAFDAGADYEVTQIIPGKISVREAYIQCVEDEDSLGFRLCDDDGEVMPGSTRLNVKPIYSDDPRYTAFQAEIGNDEYLHRLWNVKLLKSNGDVYKFPAVGDDPINGVDITKGTATISVEDGDFIDADTPHALYHKHYLDDGTAEAIEGISSERFESSADGPSIPATEFDPEEPAKVNAGLRFTTDRLSEFGYSYSAATTPYNPPGPGGGGGSGPNQGQTGVDIIILFTLFSVLALCGATMRLRSKA